MNEQNPTKATTTSGNAGAAVTPPPGQHSLPPATPLKQLSAPHGKEPAPKKHHTLTWILILLVVVLAVGLIFHFRERKRPTPPPPPVSISVTNVMKGNIPVSVTSLGSVQPVYTASMSPRVDGQLVNVNYTEGQMVASNQLLAVIDPGPYQAALTQAQGQLERDKAILEGARVDLKRYQDAYKQKAIPEQQVADQTATVHQDEGTVKYDEGQVASAQVQLDYAYIRAPFAGRIGLRLVDPGNVVHAANTNPIVVVAQLQPVTVIFNVAEDYLPQIEEQMQPEREVALEVSDESSPETRQPVKGEHKMTVEAWDRADETKIAAGKVLALNNLIDSATGTIRIKAIFDNTNLTLFPNQFVNAKLIIKVLHGVDLVPTFAIQHNPDGAFVYVVTNSTVTTNGMTTNFQAVTMRNIVPGTVDGNTTEIKQGLEPGELIALDNFNKLGEGVKVTLRQPGEETQGANGKHAAGSYGKKPGNSNGSP